MAVTASAGVLRIWAAVGGTGMVRVWCWPAGRRTCAVMVSRVLVTVTSVSSSRAMRLRSRAGVAGSFQIAGQVGDQLADPGLLGVGELPGVVLAGLLAGVLGLGQGAERGVPVGFEGVGDEPVGGVDGEVAAAGQVGVVAGALDVGGAQGVGLVGAVLQLGGDGEGGLDGERGEGVDEQLPDPLVQAGAGDGLADPAGVLDAVALADVGGEFAAAALVVADGHPLPAAPADDDALQQRGAFAGRPGGAVPAVRGGVGCARRARLASYWSRVMYPGWAPGMKEIHSSRGSAVRDQLPAGQLEVAVPAEGERAGVAGIVQDPQHDVVGQRLPVDLALARARPVPPGETTGPRR